ncbi:MAG: hypothetical protein ACKO6N_13985 [Myxococcota bacterium]
MYILDTNTLIYFFKGKGMVAERLLKCSLREVGVPSIVLFELELGICLSSAPEKRAPHLLISSALSAFHPWLKTPSSVNLNAAFSSVLPHLDPST